AAHRLDNNPGTDDPDVQVAPSLVRSRLFILVGSYPTRVSDQRLLPHPGARMRLVCRPPVAAGTHRVRLELPVEVTRRTILLSLGRAATTVLPGPSTASTSTIHTPDRGAGRDIAAAVPLAYWGSFFPAALVEGTRVEDPPHLLARVVGIPINMVIAATISALTLGGWLLDRRLRRSQS